MPSNRTNNGGTSTPRPQQSSLEPQSPTSSLTVRHTHTRTISIVSDSNQSYATAVSGSPPQFHRSPSASSFFSFVSDEFYDPLPEPFEVADTTRATSPHSQSQVQTSSVTKVIETKIAFDNKAFTGDDLEPYLPSGMNMAKFGMNHDSVSDSKAITNGEKIIQERYWTCSQLTRTEIKLIFVIIFLLCVVFGQLGLIIYLTVINKRPIENPTRIYHPSHLMANFKGDNIE